MSKYKRQCGVFLFLFLIITAVVPGYGKTDLSTGITEGYFRCYMNDDMVAYYKFKEDGTYFATMWNVVSDAGTYQVLDGLLEWEDHGDVLGLHEDAPTYSGTAQQIVKLESYTGDVQKFALTEDGLRNACAPGGMITEQLFRHIEDYAYDESAEPLTEIYTFYYQNSSSDALHIFHNKTYTDSIGEAEEEGTWKKQGNEFVLINAEGNENILEIYGEKANYSRSTGDSVELLNYLSEGELLASFCDTTFDDEEKSEEVKKLPVDCDLKINLYDNRTCTITLEGEDLPEGMVVLDKGNWELDADGYTFHFEFESARSGDSELDWTHRPAFSVVLSKTVEELSTDISLDGAKVYLAVPDHARIQNQ